MEKTKRKRTTTNRRLMAWSNGNRVNIIPSILNKVDDYGKRMCQDSRI